jgi:predicted nucleic acid-binding protein
LSVPERIVINTGPLITLARIECLNVVGRLPYEFLCPEAVRRELDAGEAEGFPRIAPDWLSIRKLSGPLTGVALAALDAGEASVIQLGLLGRAKLLGLVPALEPLLEKAVREGIRYHPDLVRAVLDAVGE